MNSSKQVLAVRWHGDSDVMLLAKNYPVDDAVGPKP